MAPVLRALRGRPREFTTTLVSTGQHREMLAQVFADFNIVPDFDLSIMTKRQTLEGVAARVLSKLTPIVESTRPDAILVQGDTTTAMAAALTGFYRQVPVAHVEAGLRSHDSTQPFPEEVNRRLITVLSTWHYAPTPSAQKALLNEGIAAERIVLTGNTGIDALLMITRDLESRDGGPASGRMLLVTAHRRENFGAGFEGVFWAIRDIIEKDPTVRVVYPVHLNPKVQDPAIRILGSLSRVSLIPPVSYRELTRLLAACYFVLTDSGGIQEEAPSLGKPVLVLREVTERPEGVAAGVAKLVGTDRRAIVAAAELLLRDPAAYSLMAKGGSPYGDGKAAPRIADHLTRALFGDATGARD